MFFELSLRFEGEKGMLLLPQSRYRVSILLLNHVSGMTGEMEKAFW